MGCSLIRRLKSCNHSRNSSGCSELSITLIYSSKVAPPVGFANLTLILLSSLGHSFCALPKGWALFQVEIVSDFFSVFVMIYSFRFLCFVSGDPLREMAALCSSVSVKSISYHQRGSLICYIVWLHEDVDCWCSRELGILYLLLFCFLGLQPRSLFSSSILVLQGTVFRT